MKTRLLLLAITLLGLATFAAETSNFAGEYADRKFLNGQAVFQLSLEQSGNTVSVWFSAGYNDGRGCAPEATGTGKVTSKGAVDFTFKDSEGNAGTGTIVRTGNDVLISIKATKVADPRCLTFYRQNIRLSPQTKSGKRSGH